MDSEVQNQDSVLHEHILLAAHSYKTKNSQTNEPQNLLGQTHMGMCIAELPSQLGYQNCDTFLLDFNYYQIDDSYYIGHPNTFCFLFRETRFCS